MRLANIPQRDYKNMTAQMFQMKVAQRPETYDILS